MAYVKGGLVILAIFAFVLLVEIIYQQRRELQNTNVQVEQDIEQLAQSSIDSFDNMQNNFNNAVEDAEKIYSEELGL